MRGRRMCAWLRERKGRSCLCKRVRGRLRYVCVSERKMCVCVCKKKKKKKRERESESVCVAA
jgi:hypothetical protein